MEAGCEKFILRKIDWGRNSSYPVDFQRQPAPLGDAFPFHSAPPALGDSTLPGRNTHRFTLMTSPPLDARGGTPPSGAFFQPRRSLITKLTLIVGLTLAALIALLLVADFYFGRQTLQRAIDQHLSSVASSRQDMVLAHLAQLKQRAELLADHGEFRGLFQNLMTGHADPTNTGYSQARLDYITDHRTIFSASLVDGTGHVELADKDTQAGGEVGTDPAFLHGLAGPYVGLPRAVGNRFEVVLAAPIRGYELPRKNIAVLMITVDVSPLAAAVRDTTGLGETGEVVLGIREVNNVRTLFPPRHQKQPMTIPLGDEPAMAEALAGREFLGTTRDYRGERVLAAALPVSYGGWGLVTKMDASEAYAPIARALRYILLCGGTVTVVGLVAAYLLARGIARPIQRLVQAASRVGSGDYDTPVPVKSADEFGVLSARFNEMTAAIRARGAERDAQEAALHASDERLRQVMDLVPHFIFAKDIDGRFIFANRALAQVFEMTPEELVGHCDTDLGHDEKQAARYRSDDHEVIAHGCPKIISEERHTDLSGRIRILQTTKVPFVRPGAEKPGVLGVSVDITERKRAEEERQRVETKLQETQKLESLGVLAGGIAHDFNNLLTGVIGNASLASADLPPGSPMLPYLSQIEDSAMRAADLCKQLLAYAGKGRFIIQDLDVSALVRETSNLLQCSIDKSVILKFDLADHLPAVSADATQLRQVVMNLVINATEAIGTRSGTVSISTGLVHADRAYLDGTVMAPDLPEGDYVHLEVTDNGSGMAPETLSKIFDPFFTTKFTGRGLGLAAVLGIVRSHKGTLKVYSEPGKGTSFKILLPCTAAPAIPPASAETATDLWRGSGTVLVVDDEETVRLTAGRMLQSLGFTVVTANDGREAVDRFRAAPDEFCAVLLDLTMPHLDGEGVFRELRLVRPEVRVLLMSGFNEQEAIKRFIGKGLAGFLQKPFRFDSLRERIKEILA